MDVESEFDASDADAGATITYEIVSGPSNGKLFIDAVEITSYVTPVPLTGELTYLGNEDFFNQLDSFTYFAKDEFGAKSLAYRLDIMVGESNDNPVALDAAAVIDVNEGVDNNPIVISGNDEDLDARFLISNVTIKSHTTTSEDGDLGTLSIGWNGVSCDTPIPSLPYTFNISETPVGGGVDHDLVTICFNANPSGRGNRSAMYIGTDTITFELIDEQFAISNEATFQVRVQNALKAGCGVVPDSCAYVSREDKFEAIDLEGKDSKNRPKSTWEYRITSLPANGVLSELSGGGGVLSVGDLITADATTGLGRLYYTPNLDYFNRYCLNEDRVETPSCVPDQSVTQSGVGLGGEDLGDLDFFGFSMKVGGDESPEIVRGVTLTVIGENDLAFNVTGNNQIKNLNKNTQYFFSEFETVQIMDVDKDTRYVAVEISSSDLTTTQIMAPTFTYLEADEIEFLPGHGEDCYETGECELSLIVKGYLSHVNLFLSKLQFVSTLDQGKITIRFDVWDEGLPTNVGGIWDISDTDALTLRKEVKLFFGEEQVTPEKDPIFDYILYGSIAGGSLFVLVACFGCCSSLFHRAHNGERSAQTFIKYFLCTAVHTEKMRDRRNSEIVMDAEKGLNKLVKADHKRMVEMMWCAYLINCLCPCCTNYDPKKLKIPTVDELMEKVVKDTADSIAQKHRPSMESLPPMDEQSGDGESFIENDRLADDSIFDWERHESKDFPGRFFYYNSRTHESRWEPPLVKVKVDGATLDKRVSRKATEQDFRKKKDNKRFEPRPPPVRKPGDRDGNTSVEGEILTAEELEERGADVDDQL